jgi:hypothetical protein
MNEMELHISDIPQQFLNQICQELSLYSIGLVGLNQGQDSEEVKFLGSGTLIEVEGITGILTADHVTEVLPNYDQIGLALTSELHRYVLEKNILTPIPVGRGQVESKGPDLSVIILPSAAVGQIRAIKSFYNLTRWRDELRNIPFQPSNGLWFVCGFPYKRIASEGPKRGFADVQGIHGICGVAPIQTVFEEGEYDYLELKVSYDEYKQPLRDFRGVSGGGLWQIQLIATSSGDLRAGKKILSGVVFYQDIINESSLILRGHGRRSIYKVTYDSIIKWTMPH